VRRDLHGQGFRHALFYDNAVRCQGDQAVIDVDRVATALRVATLQTRESTGAPPMYWAPYIHTGP